MSYKKQLSAAATWLKNTQGADKGWGFTAGQTSSIVNTAEALHVLYLDDPIKHSDVMNDAVKFIRNKLPIDLKKNNYSRYPAFALYGALTVPGQIKESWIKETIQILLDGQNTNGGWGHVLSDQTSCLSSTAQVLWILNNYRDEYLDLLERKLEPTSSWLIAAGPGGKWRLSQQKAPSPIATSMALLALAPYNRLDQQQLESAKKLLLENKTWGIEAEDLPGAPWEHCSYQWILQALHCLEVEPYSGNTIQAINAINEFAYKNGWNGAPNGHMTISGQYWAAVALSAVHKSFDPCKHPFQFEKIANSNYSQDIGKWPLIHRHLELSYSSLLYKCVAWLLLAIGLILISDLYAFMLPSRTLVNWIIGVLFIASSFLLVQYRKELFHRIIVTVVSFLIYIYKSSAACFGFSFNDFKKILSAFHLIQK